MNKKQILLMLMAAGLGLNSMAESIGVNFAGKTGGDSWFNREFSDPPNQAAGVMSQVNWSNHKYNGGVVADLIDDAGQGSGVSIAWQSTATARVGRTDEETGQTIIAGMDISEELIGKPDKPLAVTG